MSISKEKQIATYIIHNSKTNEMYVGSTKDFSSREKQHKKDLKNNTHHNKNLQKAYNRNPSDFDFVAVPTETREEAYDFEQLIIDEFFGRTPLFLNLDNEARAGGIKNYTTEIREKMRLAKIGKPQSLENIEKRTIGLKNYWGKEENKIKSSELRKKYLKDNPEAIERIRETSTGRIHSPETIEKIKQGNIGKTRSNENIETLRYAHLSQARAVIINDVIYKTISEASRSLNIPVNTIHGRINNINFPDWNYI